MDRLTAKRRAPRGAIPAKFAIDFIFQMEEDDVAGFFETMNQLADYEDTGYSPADFDKLCREMSDLRMALGLDTFDDLQKIIQDDRLLVLPCAIGTPVYVHEALCDVGGRATYEGCKYGQDCMRDRTIKCPLRVVKRPFTLNMRQWRSKSFWLTKKEAEDAIPADRRG